MVSPKTSSMKPVVTFVCTFFFLIALLSCKRTVETASPAKTVQEQLMGKWNLYRSQTNFYELVSNQLVNHTASYGATGDSAVFVSNTTIRRYNQGQTGFETIQYELMNDSLLRIGDVRYRISRITPRELTLTDKVLAFGAKLETMAEWKR
jgi:hypothetical protein